MLSTSFRIAVTDRTEPKTHAGTAWNQHAETGSAHCILSRLSGTDGMKSDDWNESIVAELKRLAGAAMKNERVNHTLQPTALVNEAFMVLRRQENIDIEDRSQFVAAAANSLRRILVDHARRKRADKRGGPDRKQIALEISLAAETEQSMDILALHEALEELERQSERAAKVVELRFFGGLVGEEVAKALDVSLRTVNNDWKFAKAWLYRRMSVEE